MRIFPSRLHGTVQAPASKSHAHRLLIAAALGDRPAVAEHAGGSADIEATLRCLGALGAQTQRSGDAVRIVPVPALLLKQAAGTAVPDGTAARECPAKAADAAETDEAAKKKVAGAAGLPGFMPRFDCGESGSTLRFFTPLAAALYPQSAFCGGGRLDERPLAGLLAALAENGVTASADHTPFTLVGRLSPGVFTLPGNVSSQYVTGLLLALPLLAGDSRIRLTTALSSAGYVALTMDVLKQFSIEVTETADGWFIPGGQRYRTPQTLRVEGDWSGAAFLLAAGAVFGPVTVTGLDPRSHHADRAVTDLLQRFGAEVRISDDGAVTVSRGDLHGIRADVDTAPDLALPLAAAAAFAQGETVLTGCGRLRLKESDRVETIIKTLLAFGIGCEAEKDTIRIRGGRPKGAAADGFGDHRVAMLAALLAAGADGPSRLTGADCVIKSYPDFFSDYQRLGGVADDV